MHRRARTCCCAYIWTQPCQLSPHYFYPRHTIFNKEFCVEATIITLIPRFLEKVIFLGLNLTLCFLSSFSLSCWRVVELNCLIWFCSPSRSNISVFGEGTFSLLVYWQMEIIVPGREPEIGKSKDLKSRREKQFTKRRLLH